MYTSRPDFYLASSEGYGLETPRRCFRVKRLRGDDRDDYLLIKVDPPIIGQKYGLGGDDIESVIIATRHKDASLFPINEWPIFVYVARVLVDSPERREIIRKNELELIAWAELYRTEDEARTKSM